MTVSFEGVVFDYVDYDAEADVLYLSVGQPREAADSEETIEGHAMRFDENGDLIGITIVDAKNILERDGSIMITPPPRPPVELGAEDLAPAFA
jgi:uncharacterized protein YuzE